MSNMENVTRKFFENMRPWLRKIIPQETKNCLRTSIGVIIGTEDNKTVTIRLVGSKKDGSEDLKKIKISGEYKINDVVVVGYTDNSLTNAFVLFNLNSTGTKIE